MSLKKLAQQIRAQGRGPDTELVHFTKDEVAGLNALARASGHSGLTTNPKTGLPEAGILSSMLPTLLGIGANFIVPGSGAIVGGLAGALQNKKNPLMGAAFGALGGSGGEALAQGLTQAGANAAAQQGAQAIGQAGQQVAEQGVQQAGAQAAQQAAQMLPPPTGIPDMSMAERFGAFKQGIGSLGSMDGAKAFLGSAAKDGAAATGMGGISGLGMQVGKAAAPMMLAPPEGGSGGMGEEWVLPKYRFNRNYTGGIGGNGGTGERTYFQDSYARMADGGEVPQAPQQAGPTMRALPMPMPRQQAPMQQPMGMPRSGTQPGSMTGASRAAFEYLMGRGPVQTQPPVQQVQPAPPVQTGVPPMVAAPPGGMGGGLGGVGVGGPSMPIKTPAYGYFDGPPGGRGDAGGWERGYNMQQYAQGGTVQLASGGFVIPADVVAAVGAGSSNAGMEALAKHLGATPIQGAGDGQSDSIPATIDGHTPARVARDEMHLSPQQVAEIGGGDASKGAQKLYAMMDRVRKQAMGHTKQLRPVNVKQALR